MGVLGSGSPHGVKRTKIKAKPVGGVSACQTTVVNIDANKHHPRVSESLENPWSMGFLACDF
jgi:hypothetical protein